MLVLRGLRYGYRTVVRRGLHEYKNLLLKQIHPDLFVNESAVVKSTNLTCVQNLNELFRAYQDILQLIEASPSSAVKLTSEHKFQPSYNLSCFYRPPQHKDTDEHSSPSPRSKAAGTLLALTFTLDVPVLLRKSALPGVSSKASSSVSKAKLNVSLNVFVSRFRQFLRDVGIKLDETQTKLDAAESGQPPHVNSATEGDPTEKTRSSPAARRSQRSQDVEGEKSAKASKDEIEDLDALIFERITINSYNRTAHGMFASSKKKSVEYVETEVNYFLAHSHVFMRNLSVQTEIDTTQRFRNFLVKYGELVNFSCHNWGNMIFIFYDLSETEKFDRVNQQVSDLAGAQSRRRKVDRKSLYKCTLKDGVYILECPYRFKVQDLMAFLSDNVESTLKLAY